jgi:asparagine synthetase B (glutamine-hydrolysing)
MADVPLAIAFRRLDSSLIASIARILKKKVKTCSFAIGLDAPMLLLQEK